MVRRRTHLAVVSILLLAACAMAVPLLRTIWERHEPDKLTHGAREGVITYDCGKSESVDFDRRTAGPTEFRLISERREAKPVVWKVQIPGTEAVDASTFVADTGSIGGAQGIRWRQTDGRVGTAILSYSDMIGDFGPDTIWLVRSPAPGTAIASPQQLTCGPDPDSFRPF